MDQPQISNELIQGLSAKDKQDLNQFIQGESQKAQIQQTVHGLTDTCFKKCVTSKIAQGTLDRYEEPCMRNCVDRFMDANRLVIENLERMRQ
ncbi:zf-Tim10_DDP-domain-containing protein [Sphaerulina musiva SO2202]|uniref:Mitochondrial import inner membrane translocase subunit n=1 Tax=Sphaerulina musiva (strain SO2202) TaxID=692275 RepID=N1QFL4_SPHMS|nr:zf-Tim10_DDP-domain-containing protein [Sphaerulina musiva SO2202]EMF12093.1 zf-Tim10_DDP-domain-containing protein [Sphaerulina musiva SO2202]